ncbi:MAG: hypothetical protein U0X73_16485 [Thermoanaerobaculia bacterium]
MLPEPVDPPQVARLAPLASRAASEIAYIRRTMERSAGFTAVPGWGSVGMGAIGLAATFLAREQPTPGAWLAVWVAAAVLAFALGAVSLVRKAERAGVSLSGHAARSFVRALLPALAVGALLTGVLWRAGSMELLPGVWLLLYGLGVTAAGAFSVPCVPIEGACLLAVGALALLFPGAADPWLLGLGFGLLQIGFGLYMARRHGG